ncbi:hypothetical protein L596_029556 [Steinernema carpocapsae]|uniref:Peptidase S1 domain-containing protein n=1 Tax=Steinernema carpocapsae TaxID=34508 RepID=A0A4U5LUZ9_STECR|nr:hypothetical protein L596_029556 [Steinernema carpocapsae]
MTTLRAVVSLLLLLPASLQAALEFLTVARPGDSPTISKITSLGNKRLQETCGYNTRTKDFQQPEFKVSGGKKSQVADFPWAIAIAQRKNQQSYCGGTIVSSKHFISAAHCFFDYSNNAKLPCKGFGQIDNFDSVIHYGGTCTRAGSKCSSANTRTTRLRKVVFARVFHDGGCSRGRDLAIAEIEGEFVLDAKAKPICLPQKHNTSSDLDFYSIFTNYGFGQDQNGARSDSLAYVDFQRYSVALGAPDVVEVTPTDIKGICRGDSGSGFQAQSKTDGRNFLLGVHSIGPPCGKGHVYKSTYIPLYVDVICEKTGICPRGSLE